MNAKMIEALESIRNGLDLFIGEAKAQLNSPVEVVTQPDEARPVVEVKDALKPATTTRKEREASETLPEVVSGSFTEEQLNALSYNNLKKLAKEIGVPAIGSRDELTQKILNFTAGEIEVEKEAIVAEEEVAQTPDPKHAIAPALVENGLVPQVVEDEEEEEEDSLAKKVNEAVADMTNEEIMDVLADVGVKAKGKRQALISAVIKAVEEGKLDLDDDGAEEAEEEETPAQEESHDGVNDPENPAMTKERREAILAHISDTREGFESGELTREDIGEWLSENFDVTLSKKVSDEELLEEYLHYTCLLINDEGEMPEEEGAYLVNDTPYCCGRELKYNEDNSTYICEACGAEYEAE